MILAKDYRCKMCGHPFNRGSVVTFVVGARDVQCRRGTETFNDVLEPVHLRCAQNIPAEEAASFKPVRKIPAAGRGGHA